jgi:integrase
MLADLVRRVARKSAGMADDFEGHRGRPLAEHLLEWEAELRTRPRGKRKRPPSTEHVRRTIARVRRVLDGCCFVLAGDIALTPVQDYLQQLTSERRLVDPGPGREAFTRDELAALLEVGPQTVRSLIKRHRLAATGNGKARRYPRSTAIALLDLARQGLGTCTVGYYAREVKAFTRWLAKRKRLPEDPLTDLPGASADDSDHRRERRALNAEELRRLLAAAMRSVIPFRGMTGPDRHHLYLVAMGTGFRAKELAALCPEHFELGNDLPVIRLSANVAKNGRTALQPITFEMAETLSEFLKGRSEGCRVWAGTWHERAADMLRIDLEAAGISYTADGPEGPLYGDFHSLRHSYVAMLDRAGVTLKEAMHLARHADPKLTMKRYGKPQLHDLAAALDRLPRLLLDHKSSAQ